MVFSVSFCMFPCGKDDSDYLAFKEITLSNSKFVYRSSLLWEPVLPLSAHSNLLYDDNKYANGTMYEDMYIFTQFRTFTHFHLLFDDITLFKMDKKQVLVWPNSNKLDLVLTFSVKTKSTYFSICFVLVHSRLKCLGVVPVLWSKWPLASSLLQATKTCHQACPPGYLMHFS